MLSEVHEIFQSLARLINDFGPFVFGLVAFLLIIVLLIVLMIYLAKAIANNNSNHSFDNDDDRIPLADLADASLKGHACPLPSIYSLALPRLV